MFSAARKKRRTISEILKCFKTACLSVCCCCGERENTKHRTQHERRTKKVIRHFLFFIMHILVFGMDFWTRIRQNAFLGECRGEVKSSSSVFNFLLHHEVLIIKLHFRACATIFPFACKRFALDLFSLLHNFPFSLYFGIVQRAMNKPWERIFQHWLPSICATNILKEFRTISIFNVKFILSCLMHHVHFLPWCPQMWFVAIHWLPLRSNVSDKPLGTWFTSLCRQTSTLINSIIHST